MRAAFCTLFLFLVGCTSTSQTTPQTVATLQTVAISEGQIRSGDALLIEFTKDAALELHQIVDAKGDISLPLAGKLRVAGMNLQEAARAIENAYLPQCVRPLRVSVSKS